LGGKTDGGSSGGLVVVGSVVFVAVVVVVLRAVLERDLLKKVCQIVDNTDRVGLDGGSSVVVFSDVFELLLWSDSSVSIDESDRLSG
jgi:hypothetical protein